MCILEAKIVKIKPISSVIKNKLLINSCALAYINNLDLILNRT